MCILTLWCPGRISSNLLTCTGQQALAQTQQPAPDAPSKKRFKLYLQNMLKISVLPQIITGLTTFTANSQKQQRTSTVITCSTLVTDFSACYINK